jgi:alpha-tubulin suppressor-like RCC1 family protein
MKKIFLSFLLILCMLNNLMSQTISGGLGHTILICNGNGFTVGQNGYGQLGDGTTINKNTAIGISQLTSIIKVSSGTYHSLFLKSDGTVWACGSNSYGQLGDGTVSYKTIPFQIPNLTGVIAIAAGNGHSLFLKSDGTVWACGYNQSGQLGDGTYIKKLVPIQVSNLSGIVDISAGESHSLFLKNDGMVWGCGWNIYGELGDGTNVKRTTPIQISSITNISEISAGNRHSLFVKNDGTVYSCGQNDFGQLGDGTYIDKNIPTLVSSISGITKVSAAVGNGLGTFSLFLNSSGTVFGCGRNNYGQLCDGTNTDKTTPTQCVSLTNIVEIANGTFHSMFKNNLGNYYVCGYNFNGQLGIGTNGVGTDLTTSVLMPVCGASGVYDAFGGKNISIYPNPSNGNISIDFKDYFSVNGYTIMVTNLFGQSVYSDIIKQQKSTFQIPLSNSKGIYFVKIADSQGQPIEFKKIVIE